MMEKPAVSCDADRLSPDLDAVSEMSPDERAQHRKRWLDLWARLSSSQRPVTIQMHDGLQVDATFLATDASQTSYLVSDLQTPIGVVPSALLRQSDILSLNFPLGENNPR
mmetsp:Transcript_32717/g.62826  ORF Transcript_32717/g.62826 Transcript_32717/m.62826 type:complete len:110 (+) Transcript_32717:68-397(+)